MLAAAALGLLTAFLTGLALVPRVRVVEVLTIVASSVGAGASMTAALAEFKQARTSRPQNRALRR
jgi:hypothetical protein